MAQEFPLDDFQLARRFADAHRGRLRWDGKAWRENVNGVWALAAPAAVQLAAMELLDGLTAEALAVTPDWRRQLAKAFAAKCRSMGKIGATLKLASLLLAEATVPPPKP